jgi:BirA family biotin operon repressor/biotin-[acetyl-CoA-carboxylase] ligase
MTGFLARHERFDRVASTNDVVRAWLADGTAEVCLATADVQTAGRGRADRTWIAPAGTGLLLSLGFRPAWIEPTRAWRVAATVALAMAAAAETVAGMADGAIRLKWPNDLAIESGERPARKVAGLLGETEGLGTDDPRLVVGLGINADWRAVDFPPDLAGSMTSLRETAGDRPFDSERLLAAFLAQLEPGIEALRAGRFDAAAWADRQLTTGRTIRLEAHDRSETVRAVGVEPATGALLVEDRAAPGGARQVLVGEVTHVRLADPASAAV